MQLEKKERHLAMLVAVDSVHGISVSLMARTQDEHIVQGLEFYRSTNEMKNKEPSIEVAANRVARLRSSDSDPQGIKAREGSGERTGHDIQLSAVRAATNKAYEASGKTLCRSRQLHL